MVLVPLAFVAGAAAAFGLTHLALRRARARRRQWYGAPFASEQDLAGLEREAERWNMKASSDDAASDDLDDAVRRSVQSAIDETRRQLHPPPAVLIRVKP